MEGKGGEERGWESYMGCVGCGAVKRGGEGSCGDEDWGWMG